MMRVHCAIAITLAATASTCMAGWTANPAISDVSIKRSKAITWVNIAETVSLQVKGIDYDTQECDAQYHAIDGQEFINLAGSTWSVPEAGHLNRLDGAAVVFNPTVATDSDITVNVSVPDRLITGLGAKDQNATKSIKFKSYKVGCWLVINGESTGEDVWQTGGVRANSCMNSALTFLDTHEIHDITSSYTPNNISSTGYWKNTITPGSATLDSGGLIITPCKLDWYSPFYGDNGSAYISGVASDDVADGTSEVKCTVSLSIPGTPLGISISSSQKNNGAGKTSQFAGAIALNSDLFDDVGVNDDNYKLELISDGHIFQTWKTKQINISQSKNLTTGVDGEGHAVGVAHLNMWATFNGCCGDDLVQDVYVNGKIHAVQYMYITGRPTYTPGTGCDPDPGYEQ